MGKPLGLACIGLGFQVELVSLPDVVLGEGLTELDRASPDDFELLQLGPGLILGAVDEEEVLDASIWEMSFEVDKVCGYVLA